MESNRGSQVVACSLGQVELSHRAARWTELATRAHARASRTESGLRLIFTDGHDVGAELRELANLERNCCAFATWSVHENIGHFTLDIDANTPEGIAAVQAMFTLPSSTEQSSTQPTSTQ
jgi:hypothetical protein